jgi:hypothetical protein
VAEQLTEINRPWASRRSGGWEKVPFSFASYRTRAFFWRELIIEIWPQFEQAMR